MSSWFEQYRYVISDIKLENPPASLSLLNRPMFIIEIDKVTGNNRERLKSVVGNRKKNQVVWSEQILYNVTSESTITFKILIKKGRADDLEVSIGEYTDIVSSLLLMQSSAGVCKVFLGQPSQQLSFTIKKDRFKDLLEEAKRKSEGIHFAQGVSLSAFLSYFDLIKTAADSALSLHQYGHQAWSVFALVPSILQMHTNRNTNVQSLFDRLADIYKYINEADRLSVLTETQSDKLKLLINTTCECVDFIKIYTKNNAATNFIKGPGFDNNISKFKGSFDQIFKTIQDSLILHIGITTSNNNDFDRLGEIPYGENVGLDYSKMCLHGTRENLIGEIVEWVNQEDTSARVLLLSGQAGTGKSAVAHTVAKRLDDDDGLGSFFCFNRSNKGRISVLFSTISRNLADHKLNFWWRRNLVQATEKTAVRKSLDPIIQFNEMIIKPSNGIPVGMTERVAIIIDALDEAGDQSERKILLNLLFERSSELPTNFRIIITCRPEHDIARFYQDSENVCCKSMANIDPDDTLNDIQKLISHELSGILETLDAVNEDWCLLLAQSAQNLFIWAKLACVYILKLDSFEAENRLKDVLSKPTSSVNEMYHKILDAQPGWQHDSSFTLLKTFVGAVIVSRRSLSVSDLREFFGPISGGSKKVNVLLRWLNSLFLGLDQSASNIRPIHTSLFDFFLNPEQKAGIENRYFIDKSDQSSFAHACLRVMKGMLRFNICGLETSHKRNREVQNFKSRVTKAVPSYLSYACCFWAYHLEHSILNLNLREEIYDLVCENLLYLFEVLGLLEEIEQGRSGMQRLKNITEGNDYELNAWAVEASVFLWEFGEMMTESTPHLYLSALPYISTRSLISQQFLPQYPQLLSMDVQIGQPITLQPQIKNSVVKKHPSSVSTALAFSPKDQLLATGFKNGDLWVWDYFTGEILCKESPKDTATAVCHVVFSLDGELVYCCFEDGDILTWEVKTKKVFHAPNDREKCCQCYISPDGHYIVQHRERYSHPILFHERETRAIQLEDGDIRFDRFSPSGRFCGFALHSSGGLRLWDTQEKIFVPVVSNTDDDRIVVAFSDSYVVVRGSEAYEAYDIRTGTMVRQLKRQTPGLKSELKLSYGLKYAFSTNGDDLLCSGYMEKDKHWIWKISTGEFSHRFRPGYLGDNYVFTAALSPDAKYMAYCANEATTVLAWDGLDQKEIDWNEYGDDDGEWSDDEAWLKDQHLVLYKYKRESPAGSGFFQVLDAIGLAVFSIDAIDNPFTVSPEDNHWNIAYARSNQLCLWNIDEKEECTLHELDYQLEILVFSTSGDRLISCDDKNNIKVWDVRTHTLISCGEFPNKLIALALSGATFWVAYNTDSGDCIEERECSESQSIINGPFLDGPSLHSIALTSNNNAYICTCHSQSGLHGLTFKLRILNHSTGESTYCFEIWQPPVFSPNRRYVSFQDPTNFELQVWDLERGMALDKPQFEGRVWGFEFSDDSTRICIQYYRENPAIGIWDIKTGTLAAVWRLGSFSFPYIARSPYIFESSPEMAFHKGSLLINQTDELGVWDLRVNEIVTRLYDDRDSQPSGMTPEHPQIKQLIEDYKLCSENTKLLNYALIAWNKASFLPWTKSSNGWILGQDGELLFWVPEEMRWGLQYPSMSFKAFERKSTKLHFDNFVHGTKWIECKKQLNL